MKLVCMMTFIYIYTNYNIFRFSKLFQELNRYYNHFQPQWKRPGLASLIYRFGRAGWPMTHGTVYVTPPFSSFADFWLDKEKGNKTVKRAVLTLPILSVCAVWLPFNFSFYSDFYETISHYQTLKNFHFKGKRK